MASHWEKIQIVDDQGKSRTAIAPVIISASRSTDIPAFYAEWFIERLRKGYCTWINPFNGKAVYVSFAKTRFIVFWTKNPAPFIPFLSRLDERGIGYYFNFTLNDYDVESYEPHVPPVSTRIDTFKTISDRVGSFRVVWRFDPLLLTDQLDVPQLMERVYKIMQRLSHHTNKLVFSFVDIEIYRKVKQNLQKSFIQAREFSHQEMLTAAEQIGKMAKEHSIDVATCAECIDLERFGIFHNRCIDDDLITRCCPNNKELLSFLGLTPRLYQTDLFASQSLRAEKTSKRLKDPGQREACGCIVSKDIGQYNTCPHLCTYCYANSAGETVMRNWNAHRANPLCDQIVPIRPKQ